MQRSIICAILLSFISPSAAPIMDSLPITGYYEQQGKLLSHRRLEKFLRDHDSSGNFADRARAYRISAGCIGATMWGINLGISIYQIKYLIDAIERQEPISLPLSNLTTPLLIGGEVADIVQSRLRNRSDFLLHKAAMAFNQQVVEQKYPDSTLDFHIEKLRYGWYRQDRLHMPEHVLFAVLREKEASRIPANWSIVFREIAQPVQGAGALFLFYAIMGFIEPLGVDADVRNAQLSLGISLTGFGIVNSIVSAVIRNRAIKKYNVDVSTRVSGPGIEESTE